MTSVNVTTTKNTVTVNGETRVVTISVPGQTGARGEKGDKGDAATVSVGNTTTGDAGTDASVTASGSPSSRTLNFTIPRGAIPTISIGTVSTGNAGSNASVSNVSNSDAEAILDFSIPIGATGAPGVKGDKGDKGDTGDPGTNGTNGADGADGTNGADGADGAAATITAGSATSLASNASPTVTNSGSSSAAVFNFGIPKGEKGDTGAFGGATFEYEFNTSTSDADPGGGKLAFNNSTLQSATVLFIDDTDKNSTDIQPFLRTIDDSTSTIKGHFKLSEESNPDNFRLYTISAATEATGYHKVTCAYVSGDASFSSDENLVITFARTGDKGDKGDQGIQGNQGIQGLQGPTGPQGPAGPQGATGNIGPQGPQGPAGADGGISDGNKGDIVVSNSGATFTIDDDVVTAAKLADTGVTAGSYTNANITVDDQGRITTASSGSAGGGGSVTGVTGTAPIVSSGGNTPAISISAATTSAAGSMSASDKQKLDNIDNNARDDQTASEIKTLLQSDKLTVDEIADDAITDAKLANSINTAIAANTAKVTNATHTGDVTGSTSLTIVNDAVTTDKIADDAVTADKLANSINTEIAANTAKVTNATHTGDVTGATALTIANQAVTYAKIQNVSATDRILGRDSAGAGVIEEITPANLRTMINVEDGATADQTKSDIDALGIAATTADTLATARNIGGVSFDGSANIDLPGVNTAGNQNTTGLSGGFTAGDASNLNAGTIPDARFPSTLPVASATNLTSIPAANITGTLPAIDGSNLTGILSDLVNDTTPQLGGDLDMNSKFISSGVLGIKNTGSQSELRLYCEVSNAHYASIKAPAHADFSGNITYTLPSGYGSNGQVLKSDGSGGTSWVDQPTANATHSGEVTGSTALTIADNVVDEANLKVSNSPTDGYVLTAQSGNTGGLTWAEASGGGGLVGGGSESLFVEAENQMDNDFSTTTNKNYISAGPLTIASGKVLTIVSGSVMIFL